MFANSNSEQGAGTGPNRNLSSEAWKTSDSSKARSLKPLHAQRPRTTQFGRIAGHKLREQIGEDGLQFRSCGRDTPPGGEEHAVTIPSRRPVKEGVASAERHLLGIRWIGVHDFVEGLLSDLRFIDLGSFHKLLKGCDFRAPRQVQTK